MMVRPYRRLALTAALALACPGIAAAVVNTGQAALQDLVACNGRVGFLTSEAQQNVDLNGDGVKDDVVFQVLDVASGTVTNSGLEAVDAPGPVNLVCGSSLFAFFRNESDIGADFDGDGANDVVVQYYDAATNTPISVAIAAVSQQVLTDDIVAIAADEGAFGVGGTDFTGDGDTLDQAVFAAALPNPLGALGHDGGGGLVASGDVLAFIARESVDGDQNGDGDTDDEVLFIWDGATSTLVATGLAVYRDVQVSDRIVAFRVDEANQGAVPAALNGDLDTTDGVLHTWCLPGAACAVPGPNNLGLAAETGFAFEGDVLAFRVRERAQGNTNLNGDADTNDYVVHVHRPSTGVTKNLGLDAVPPVRVSGNHVAFAVYELRQGVADRNGDGDVRDIVVELYDAAADQLTNVGRGIGRSCRRDPKNAARGRCLALGGDVLVFLTSERDQDRTDLNGDGDHRDAVAETYRLSDGQLFTSGVAGLDQGGLTAAGNLAAFRASELKQGASLNGDTDRKDEVMTLIDVSGAGSVSVLGLQATDNFLLESGKLVFRTYEKDQSVVLNGDTDKLDSVLHVAP